jgi:DNA-directed RNA polymerase specialized sigma24 family protein
VVRKTKPVAEEVRIRLVKANEEAQDRKDAWVAALEQRDRIVVEAVDVHGASQQSIAAALGVAKGRISAILAGSQPDEGDE